MMIQGGAAIQPAGVQRAYPAPQVYAAPQEAEPERKEDLSRRFDSFSISENGQDSRRLALKGRLSQEVRTATSTDMIAALREQVRSGTYQPDPAAIARKMLLAGEAG